MFHDVPHSYDLKGNLRHNGPTVVKPLRSSGAMPCLLKQQCHSKGHSGTHSIAG